MKRKHILSIALIILTVIASYLQLKIRIEEDNDRALADSTKVKQSVRGTTRR